MKKLANILFISSMLIFGTIGIIVKFIPLASSEIAFYRSILALLVISLYFIVKKEKLQFGSKRSTLFLLLLSGIGIGVNWIFLFESYNYTSLSITAKEQKNDIRVFRRRSGIYHRGRQYKIRHYKVAAGILRFS